MCVCVCVCVCARACGQVPRIVDLNPGWQSYLTAAAQIQFCIAIEKLHELFRRQNPW